MKFKATNQIHFTIIIFFLVAGLLISSAIIELQQSKKELYELMGKQANSLLESLIIASENTLLASNYLDQVAKQRLLNNAVFIKRMYETGQVNNTLLTEICNQNNLFRIRIYDKNGKRLFRSHSGSESGTDPTDLLEPIFSGIRDTLEIGYKESQNQNAYRYAVALAASDRSAIVINIDASEMLSFKKDIDFGGLIRQVTRGNTQINYIALQDTAHILAASGNVNYLDSPGESAFLRKSLIDSSFQSRTVQFDSIEVFEAVLPFSYGGEIIGLFRIGLSLEPVQDINKRIYRRLVVITIILIIIGFGLFVYLFTRQRLNLLQKQYEVIETYSGNIINNVSDAIIVLDSSKGIKVFNDASEKLFSEDRKTILGQNLDHLFSAENCEDLLENSSFLKNLDCMIAGQRKNLLISKSRFEDSDGNENLILVIRDLTEQKQLEAQLERKQRLAAMGELASGVAHEIRNPLNTIGTIVQQLNKDFEPVKESNEYHELAGLVHSEVKRINDTVQDFLRFARPEPIDPVTFSLSDFLQQLQLQYKSILLRKNIELTIESEWDGRVFWDKNQIKQVFINLIENAIDAVERYGQINIRVRTANPDELEIRFSDNGAGIDENILDKIFNLYFTTKAKGTGIGLSIVQRIIYEHEGLISVESSAKTGSTFIIRLPVKVTKKSN